MAIGDELRERRLAVVREHMESENRREFDVTLGTFEHPRYELVATREVFDGAAQVSDYYAKSRASFPDQRNENAVLRATEDTVIAEFDLLGTHEGELGGVAATGRTFRCRMCAVFEFHGDTDRIVCERVYFDRMTIAQQLFGEEIRAT
jgi:steroid delta-isomerase-like uncharacterized protein